MATTDGAPRAARAQDGWAAAIDRVCEDPELVRTAFQPIVDLRRGLVAGYEALARFPAMPGATPDVWFAQAARLGRQGILEAVAVRSALRARPVLSPTCFLAVNVSPGAVGHPEVLQAFDAAGSLRGVVVELTDEISRADHEELHAALAPLRGAGAALGFEYGRGGTVSLRENLALGPEYVKVGRAIVDLVDEDHGIRADLSELARFTARHDVRVVAAGVERLAALDVLIRLRVPLGQGFALGRPDRVMAKLGRGVGPYVRERHGRPEGDGVIALLVDRAPALPEEQAVDRLGPFLRAHPDIRHVALLDRRGRPVAIASRADAMRGYPPRRKLLRAPDTSLASDVARRAVARRGPDRLDPVVCCDELGRYIGLVPVEQLVYDHS